MGFFGGLSEFASRAMLAARAGLTFKGKRDLFEALGYLRTLEPSDLRARYERGGLAARVIEALPKATWRGDVEVIEDEDQKKETAFEQEMAALDKRIGFWSALSRTDILAGIGYYGILFIGVPGKPSEPAPDRFKADDVKYLQPYGDDECVILTYDQDPESERFGLPETYQVTRRARSNFRGSSFIAHWTRVLHVAHDKLDDAVFGHPELARVWNYFDDLEKIVGGGAEAFWKRVDKGMIIDLDKDVEVGTDDAKQLKEAMDEMIHGMRRSMITRGGTIQDLGSNVANFSQQVDAIVTLVAGAKGIPKRILVGSERGSLASTQDRENWNELVQARRKNEAETTIARPFVQFLIDHGAVTTPKEFRIAWPELETASDAEKMGVADVASKLNNQAGGTVITPEEIRSKIVGYEPLTPEQVATIAKDKAEKVAMLPPVFGGAPQEKPGAPAATPPPVPPAAEPKTAAAPATRREIRARLHGPVRYAVHSAFRAARVAHDHGAVMTAHGSEAGIETAMGHVQSVMSHHVMRAAEHFGEAHGRMQAVTAGRAFRYAGSEDQPRDEAGKWTNGGATFYHGTSADSANGILKDGIISTDRQAKRIYLTSDLNQAQYYARGEEAEDSPKAQKGAVIKVQIPLSEKDNVTEGGQRGRNHFVYRGGDIPASWVSLHKAQRNAAAVDPGAKYAASLVTDLTKQEKANVAALIQKADERGWSAKQLSTRLRESVGLDERRAGAVENLRTRLEEANPGDVVTFGDREVTVPRDGGDETWVDRQAERYSRDLLAQRSDMIAETSLAQVTADAQRDAWQERVDGGDLPDDTERMFVAGPDSCPDCLDMDGETAPIGQPYSNGSMGVPVHPLCDDEEVLFQETRK